MLMRADRFIHHWLVNITPISTRSLKICLASFGMDKKFRDKITTALQTLEQNGGKVWLFTVFKFMVEMQHSALLNY
jgi:ABC-type nickel/cobalt efflux system permease component RcnA